MKLARLCLALACMVTAAHTQETPARAPRFHSITVGQNFTCGLSGTGEATCWGANYYGQLGAGNAPGIQPCVEHRDRTSTCAVLPVRVATTRRFTNLTAALKHACGVTAEQTVLCWGRNNEGQLGTATSTVCAPASEGRLGEEFEPSPCALEPVEVEGLPPARLVAGGDDFSCAITTDGRLFCWGKNAGATPMLMSAPGARRLMTVSAGYTNVCSDTDDSRVVCWSMHGGVSEPTFHTVEGGLREVAVSSHMCASGSQTNRLWCWGYNANGSLGSRDERVSERADEPTLVDTDSKMGGAAVSFLGTCAIEVSQGHLSCWGMAPVTPAPDECFSRGEFGGRYKCARAPQPLFGDRFFNSVALANAHACGRAAEHAYCWGANNYGQLGIGVRDSDSDVPQIVGITVKRSVGRRLLSGARPVALVGILLLIGIPLARRIRARRDSHR